MQLYTKEMKGQRATYRPYTPPDCSMYEIEQSQVVTLLTTLTLSMLMRVSEQLPDHARAAREIRNVEAAIVKMAKLNAEPLDEFLVNAGVAAWNSAIETLQKMLTGGRSEN